jgi:hypothetical protein
MGKGVVNFELVKKDLESQNLGIADLAKHLGKGNSAVYAMVNKGDCSVSTLLRICNMLKQSLSRYIESSDLDIVSEPQADYNVGENKSFEAKYYSAIMENYQLGKEHVSVLKQKISELESKINEKK